MSIRITTASGDTVYDDDLGVAIDAARREGGDVPLRAILNHLELVAQAPSAFGTATSFAARAALDLIGEFVHAGDVDLASQVYNVARV